MNTDERIREILSRDDDADWSRADFSAFRRHARTRRRMRAVGVLALALVVIGGVVVVPRVVKPSGFIGPGRRNACAGCYRDPIIGYEISLPRGWAVRGEAGEMATIGPPPTPKPQTTANGTVVEPAICTCDTDPNAISLKISNEAYPFVSDVILERAHHHGDRLTETPLTLAGRRAMEFLTDGFLPRGEMCIDSDCASWREATFLVDWPGATTLRLNLYAAYEVSVSKWWPTGLGAVRSIREVAPEREEAHAREARAVRDAGSALREFMSERIGDGPTNYLMSRGTAGSNTGWLTAFEHGLSTGASRDDYIRWGLFRSTPIDPTHVRFDVQLIARMKSGGLALHTERLFFGPGIAMDGSFHDWILVWGPHQGSWQPPTAYR